MFLKILASPTIVKIWNLKTLDLVHVKTLASPNWKCWVRESSRWVARISAEVIETIVGSYKVSKWSSPIAQLVECWLVTCIMKKIKFHWPLGTVHFMEIKYAQLCYIGTKHHNTMVKRGKMGRSECLCMYR
jgi:hypothetical protein